MAYSQEQWDRAKKRRWKNKEEYIEYLESMLVLNNIKFKEM